MIRPLARLAVLALFLLSLLALAAILAMWVRGRRVNDHWILARPRQPLWWVSWGDGAVTVTRVSGWPNPERPRWRSLEHPYVLGGPFVVEYSSQPVWEGPGVFVYRNTGVAGLRRDGTAIWYTVSRVESPHDVVEPSPPGPNDEVATSPPMPLLGVTVRLWLPAVLAAVAPSLWLALLLRRTRLRRQRSRAGLCPSCAYDLRATPARCPECGKAPATKEA